jgi:hypothetical protein
VGEEQSGICEAVLCVTLPNQASCNGQRMAVQGTITITISQITNNGLVTGSGQIDGLCGMTIAGNLVNGIILSGNQLNGEIDSSQNLGRVVFQNPTLSGNALTGPFSFDLADGDGSLSNEMFNAPKR